MKRLIAMILTCWCLMASAGQPGPAEMQAYRARLSMYVDMRMAPGDICSTMAAYFPWYGAWFGVHFDRDGAPQYYVAIGEGLRMSFYAVLN